MKYSDRQFFRVILLIAASIIASFLVHSEIATFIFITLALCFCIVLFIIDNDEEQLYANGKAEE